MQKNGYQREFPLTVSVSSFGDIERNSHVDLLPDDLSFLKVGDLTECDQKLKDLDAAGVLRDWWKSRENGDEFICTIYGALSRRYWNAVAKTSDYVVFNQGIAMIEAQVVAAVAFKGNSTHLDAARANIRSLLDFHRMAIPKERHQILLKTDKVIENPLVKFRESDGKLVDVPIWRDENTADERHDVYQYMLQAAIQHQIDTGKFDHVIELRAGESVKSVQDKVRRSIQFISPVPSLQLFPDIAKLLICFTGVGESFQRSLASDIRTRYPQINSSVINARYLGNVISKRIGRKPSELEAQNQALQLYHEIERYAINHVPVHMTFVLGLTSIHIARHLKEWIGSEFVSVYVKKDAPVSTVVEKRENKQEKKGRPPSEVSQHSPLNQEQTSSSIRQDLTEQCNSVRKAQDGLTEPASIQTESQGQPLHETLGQQATQQSLGQTMPETCSDKPAEDTSCADLIIQEDDSVHVSAAALASIIDATGILGTISK